MADIELTVWEQADRARGEPPQRSQLRGTWRQRYIPEGS